MRLIVTRDSGDVDHALEHGHCRQDGQQSQHYQQDAWGEGRQDQADTEGNDALGPLKPADLRGLQVYDQPTRSR